MSNRAGNDETVTDAEVPHTRAVDLSGRRPVGRIVELSGGAAAASGGSGALQIVRAVHEAISVTESFTVTEVTDVRALAEQVQALTQQVNTLLAVAADDGPAGLPGPVARYVRGHLIELVTLLITVAGVLIALRGVEIAQQGVEQDRAEYARSDPPPPVVVPPVVVLPPVVVEFGESDRGVAESGSTTAPEPGDDAGQ